MCAGNMQDKCIHKGSEENAAAAGAFSFPV